MSVILNALRSHKGATHSSPKFSGTQNPVFKRGVQVRPAWVAKILFVALISGSAFTGVMIWFKNYMTRRTIAENSALIARAPPAVPPVPQVDKGLVQARSLYRQDRLNESLAVYQAELEKNPNSAILHNDIGLVLLRMEQLKESERHFFRATEIDSACFECFNNLGYLKTLLNQSEDAEKYFKKALAIKSTYADAYFNLAVLYEKNGDVGNAVNSYREFMEHLGDKDSAYYQETRARVKSLLER